MSAIKEIDNPPLLIALRAESLPAPGPLTYTSTVFKPFTTAFLTTASIALVAAKGVDFLVPLKPAEPAELHPITSPLLLVIVIKVLLNVEVMYARPLAETFT